MPIRIFAVLMRLDATTIALTRVALTELTAAFEREENHAVCPGRLYVRSRLFIDQQPPCGVYRSSYVPVL